MAIDLDIVIIGGGMVGASMACSLKNTNYKIAVVEAFKSDSQCQPSFDERTVALTYSSKLIFNAMGVWQDIATDAYPIFNIEVTNKDSFGLTSLSIEDVDTEALGFVVPTRRIGQVLHQRINNQHNVEFLCPATVTSIVSQEGYARVSLVTDQTEKTLTTKLVILADGGRSGLTEQLGFKPKPRIYLKSALIGMVGTNKPHHGKAYEHFTKDGPLALLPVRETDYALAWTVKEEEGARLSACRDGVFLDALQSEFGKRAGQFTHIGNRKVYPLSFSLLNRPYKERIVIIGNAAHIVHPVAGQGFNLGLRDVGFLHETLLADTDNDPGHNDLLNQYTQLRKRDTKIVGAFTDGLIRTFSSDFFPLVVGRNLGLTVINILPTVKKNLLKRTMGIYGRQSKLAMLGRR